jgi:ribosomal protein S18 acetylase RimI-like enzyme
MPHMELRRKMSNAPPVAFRRARAADAQAAIPLILSSGPEAFNYVFAMPGRTPGDFLRHAFSQGSGQFGFRNHVVGEIGGQVVAAGAGWSSASNVGFLLAAVGQFFPFFGVLGAPPVIVRGLRTEAVVRPPAAGEFYIGHLGVAPDRRGQGIGEALIAHLLAIGAETGRRRAVLDVSVENPRAQALYSRLGFRVTAERPSTLRRAAGYVPSHRRMERAM